MSQDIRWKQRFQNYAKAFKLLHEALAGNVAELSVLEQEGVVQRFEYTFELGWKTMKDYLAYSGVLIDQITPRAVIKAAFSAKIVTDGQVWMDMLEHRNLLSHVYEEERFHEAVRAITNRYLTAFEELHNFFQRQASNG